MEIRPLSSQHLAQLADIDATIHSTQYLHLERTGDGLELSLNTQIRPLRDKLIEPNRLDDELVLLYRQIVGGADEGLALGVEHAGRFAASALAHPHPQFRTMYLADVRVDFDFRRQGLGTALVFQIIQSARERGLRAVSAEVRTNNHPANAFLLKSGFDLSGIDMRRSTNHDMVKESTTLFWYAEVE
ncbi:MAG: GNAT family N-acetyltransferase [Tepidisphaeraceae bacterium]